MTTLTRPMLSAKEDDPVVFEQKMAKFMQGGRYLLCSPKLDGIRALVYGGHLYSRRLKLIPNNETQQRFGGPELEGLDGELIVGAPNAEDVYRVTDSGVMTRAENPNAAFFVFDDWELGGSFESRLRTVQRRVEGLKQDGFNVRFVSHEKIYSLDQLYAYEEKCLAHGYEGVMCRRPDGPYKQGRSTMNEGWLVKMKRFVDAEAVIIGVKELTHNDNPATLNELGYTKRSSHKANKRLGGTLGGFVCRTPAGVVFNVGGGKGLTAQLRAELWAARDQLPGRLLKYSSLPVGVKDKPRHPKFLGFRNEIDT
jgi:DNA ligase 1